VDKDTFGDVAERIDVMKYLDAGYVVFSYAYRGGYDAWNKDKALYSKYAGCTFVTEGFKNIRKQMYSWYKANRDTDQLTDKQLETRELTKPIWRDIYDNAIFQTVYNPLLEADDILAIKALQGFTIVTNDKDLAQLPEWCIIEKLDGTPLRTKLYAGLPKSMHHLEMTPDRYLLTLCLYGDKSDNIPRLIPKGSKAIKESLMIYEAGNPWELAYKEYGNALLDNLYAAILPNPYALQGKVLDKEDVYNLVKEGNYNGYVFEHI
jgi:5'-3' exonuclease